MEKIDSIIIALCVSKTIKLVDLETRDFDKQISVIKKTIEYRFETFKTLFLNLNKKGHTKKVEESISKEEKSIDDQLSHIDRVIIQINNKRESSEPIPGEFWEVLTIAETAKLHLKNLSIEFRNLLKEVQSLHSNPINSSQQSPGLILRPQVPLDQEAAILRELLKQERLLAKKREIDIAKKEIKDLTEKITELKNNLKKNKVNKEKSLKTLEDFKLNRDEIEKSLESKKESLKKKGEILSKNQNEINRANILKNQMEEAMISLKYQNFDVDFDEIVVINSKIEKDLGSLRSLEEELNRENEGLKNDQQKAEQLELAESNQINLLKMINLEIDRRGKQLVLLDNQLQEKSKKLSEMNLLVNLEQEKKSSSNRKRKAENSIIESNKNPNNSLSREEMEMEIARIRAIIFPDPRINEFKVKDFDQKEYQPLLKEYDFCKNNMDRKGAEESFKEAESNLCKYLIDTGTIDNEEALNIRYVAYQKFLEV